MRIVIFGADGFIGLNLISFLLNNTDNIVYAYDREFVNLCKLNNSNLILKKVNFTECDNFDLLLEENDLVFHLISSNIPGMNLFNLESDFISNTFPTIKLLDSCVKKKIKKIIFLSSGGAIYGKNEEPCKETDILEPISPYGLQKATLEKIFYLYNYRFSLSYNIIRLSNPYGPFQKPNRGQGVINTFFYNAINGNKITIFGDGSIIRDYIFISDAISMILNVSFSSFDGVFNVGSGEGLSINDIIKKIEKFLSIKIVKENVHGRINDIPINILNIDKYISIFGKPKFIEMDEGLRLTLKYFKEEKIL